MEFAVFAGKWANPLKLSKVRNVSRTAQATGETEFLPVDEAYQLHVSVDKLAADKKILLLNWNIADGYYLYGQRFKFTLSQIEPLPHGSTAKQKIIIGAQQS